MMHFARYLATRLRRLASPAPATFALAHSIRETGDGRNGWERLDAFVTAPIAPTSGLREREFAHENARATIALVGQDGRRLVRRVTELHELGAARASEPALLVLTLAHAQGDRATRDEALGALARVARAGSTLTPPGLGPSGAPDRSRAGKGGWRCRERRGT